MAPAFVLRYRHGPRYHYPTTLLDAQRALRLIRARAQEYRVDPAKVGVRKGCDSSTRSSAALKRTAPCLMTQQLFAQAALRAA